MCVHSQIPLQHQFLSKMLSAQILYVELYDKSHWMIALAVHMLVVEQSLDLSYFAHTFAISQDWNLNFNMVKNCEKSNIFMNCLNQSVFMTILRAGGDNGDHFTSYTLYRNFSSSWWLYITQFSHWRFGFNMAYIRAYSEIYSIPRSHWS